MSQTPAGWYPDPNLAGVVRYWDGENWTDHTSQSSAQPPPSSPPPPHQHVPGDMQPNQSWWKRPAGPLPVWAWIVGALLVIGIIGAATDNPAEQKIASRPSSRASLDHRSATTPTAPQTAEAPATTAVPTTAAPVTTPPTAPPTTAPPPTTRPALMPNVVCMNLQDAQDTIQAMTGVFYSRSFDATGRGRMQVIDSNWIVVSQTPRPGTPFGEGDANLGAVKIGEANPC